MTDSDQPEVPDEDAATAPEVGGMQGPPFAVPEGNEGSDRFSVYDTTLGQYVGGVGDKAAATKYARGQRNLHVVEV